MSRYDDILDLPRPVSGRHAPMSQADRAAQFSSFAALTGFEAVIEETARLTDDPIFMEDSAKEELNRILLFLSAREPEQPEISVTYFHADERKPGGAYRTLRGKLRRVEAAGQLLRLEDGAIIPFSLITKIDVLT